MSAYDPWAVPPDEWAEVRAKRVRAIAAKNEASAVKMNYADKVPTRHHKVRESLGRLACRFLAVTHCHSTSQAVVVPARHRAYTQNDLEVMSELAQKREDAIEFKADVRRVFNLADVDGSGELDINELAKARNSVAKAEASLESDDQDASGTLNFDEFCEKMMRTYRKTPAGARRILKTYEGICVNDERRSRRFDVVHG